MKGSNTQIVHRKKKNKIFSVEKTNKRLYFQLFFLPGKEQCVFYKDIKVYECSYYNNKLNFK